MFIVIQAADKIAADAGGIAGIIVEGLEGIAIEAVEAVDGADPYKSVVILDAALYRIVGQAILDLVMIKIIGLPVYAAGQLNHKDGYKRYDLMAASHQTRQITSKRGCLLYFFWKLIRFENILISPD